MHDTSHVVVCLAVHLEEQRVLFETGKERAALDAASQRHITPRAWFRLNAADPDARQYRYGEIPEHYT